MNRKTEDDFAELEIENRNLREREIALVNFVRHQSCSCSECRALKETFSEKYPPSFVPLEEHEFVPPKMADSRDPRH